MRTLYRITQELSTINEQLMALDGELTPEMESRLVISKQDLQEKAKNYALVILSNEADSKAIEGEVKRLTAMKKRIDSATDKLKEAISFAMQSNDLTEVNTPLVRLSFRGSKSVQINDENKLDKRFFIYKPTIDKIGIKKAIELGEVVSGAELIDKQNLQIK